jgi:hypothetical protein
MQKDTVSVLSSGDELNLDTLVQTFDIIWLLFQWETCQQLSTHQDHSRPASQVPMQILPQVLIQDLAIFHVLRWQAVAYYFRLLWHGRLVDHVCVTLQFLETQFLKRHFIFYCNIFGKRATQTCKNAVNIRKKCRLLTSKVAHFPVTKFWALWKVPATMFSR